MVYPTTLETLDVNSSNDTASLTIHPNLHNIVNRIVNSIQAQLLTGGTHDLPSHLADPNPHFIATRSFESFGGKKSTASPTLASQTAAWTLAKAWSITVGGGAITFGPGLYNHMPQMEMQLYMNILGSGMFATVLQADSTLANTHFIINHVSTTGTSADPNSMGNRIANMTLDCHLMPGWSTQTSDAIHFSRNPLHGSDGGPLGFSENDTKQVVENVYIIQPPQDGVSAAGMGGHHWQNVHVNGAGRNSFRPTFDSWYDSLLSEFSHKEGFYIQTGPMLLTNCKSYNSGNGGGAVEANGQGFIFASPISADVTLVNCEAQDNWAEGFKINGLSTTTHRTAVALIGCVADSNSVGTAGAFAGFNITNSHGTTLLGCRSIERNVGGTHNFQLNAVTLSGSNDCHLDIQHVAQDSGSGGATIGAPFKSLDGSTGLNVNINGFKGMQKPTFAASYTPDFYLGSTVGLTLTGNITVNNPGNGPYPVGSIVTFLFTQDATGGRTVTWGTAYKFGGFLTSTTPSTTSTITFQYDGTNWTRIGMSGSFAKPINVPLLTTTSQSWAVPAALQEFLNVGSRYRFKYDLSDFQQARIQTNVVVAFSASAVIRLQYSTDNTNWFYLDTGTGPSAALNATGNITGTWVDIVSGAKQEVWLRVIGINGDGTTTGQISFTILQFR